MKFIDILRTASSNMLQSKLRTFLTIAAVFIGALTLTLTNGIGSGISTYMDKQLGNLGAKDLFVIQIQEEGQNPFTDANTPKKYNPDRKVTNSGFGGPPIPVLVNADLEKIKATDGIKSVESYRNVSADYVSGPNSEKYEFSVSAYLDGTNLFLASGSAPQNDASNAQLVLPVDYVSVLGFSSNEESLGKTISIGITGGTGKQTEVKATIVGVQERSLISLGGAVINNKLLDELYDLQTAGLPESAKNQFYQATARFDANLNEEQILDLKKRLSDKGFSAQTIEDQIGIVKQVISGIVTVFNIFALIALVAATFGVVNTLLMAVQERTKEIGLMKSMGLSRGRIFLLFSTEAVLLGFWGSILGILAAVGLGQIGNSFATQTFLKNFEGLSLLGFPWQSLVSILILIMAITFLAGTLPARRAARLNPIDALRYE